MPEIKIVGLSASDGVVEVMDLNLTINSGSYTTLLGPSGSGKTTLLKSIAGILKPSKGRVYIDGVDVTDLPPYERDVGFFFQTYALFPHMTVRGNVSYSLRLKKISEREVKSRVDEILDLVGLLDWADAMPGELSGGMKQRVALARALAKNSKILLLDEPLTALDARLNSALRSELVRLAKKLALTVVHVTPDQEEAMEVSNHIVVMKYGRIMQEGSEFEVYTKPRNAFVADFLGETNFLDAKVVDKHTALYNQTELNTKQRLEGDDVVLAIRSEKILFERDSTNTVEGEAVNTNFLGSVDRFEVDVGGDVFSVQTAKQSNVKVGDRVSLYLPPEDIMVFPEKPGDEL